MPYSVFHNSNEPEDLIRVHIISLSLTKVYGVILISNATVQLRSLRGSLREESRSRKSLFIVCLLVL